MASIGKQLMLEELVDALRANNYIFFTRYQKLSVSDFGELRRKLEKVSDRALVVKNWVARLAFQKVGIKDVNGFIKGSVFMTLGGQEPQVISKVLVNFAKDRENFQLTGACLDGRLYDPTYLQGLAKLPSREVLLATVVSRLNAPIGNFVNVMGQLIRSLAVVLDQVSKQKAT